MGKLGLKASLMNHATTVSATGNLGVQAVPRAVLALSLANDGRSVGFMHAMNGDRITLSRNVRPRRRSSGCRDNIVWRS
jgi:hypothetical protein